MCVVLTPVVLRACALRRLHPEPYLLAVAMCANVGSACSPIGNPQNMLIGSVLKLSFADHLRGAALPVALSLGVLWAWLVWGPGGRSRMALGVVHTGVMAPGPDDEPAFDATQTTSMSGRILASIDAARALLEKHGHELIDPIIDATERGRARLTAAGIQVIDGEYIDPLKLVILLSSCGADGNKIEQDLLNANIDVEMANRDLIIPMITFADTPDRIDDLIDKIIESVNDHKGEPRPIEIAASFRIEPDVVVTPREAFGVRRPRARRAWREIHHRAWSTPQPVRASQIGRAHV